MKLWLNHILACPDDKSFPLSLTIYNWDSDNEFFTELLKIYEKKTLVNLKNSKNLFNIQYLDISQEEILKKNEEITLDLALENIINIIIEDNIILLKDYNLINPAPLMEYIKYYIDFLAELDSFTDDSVTESAKRMLKLVKNKISVILNDFSKNLEPKIKKIKEIQDEEEQYSKIIEILNPIFQDLLLLNYYFFLMEIDEGILVCPKYKGCFPIIKTIPRLMPKNMKKTDLDINFKEKWVKKIPSDVI
ncbi:MAG: hypothetical protein GY870_12095 [archaeon]|nr:hypothetical protein [archaeon]